jgi:diguanylate cyclase (GGDEF)-like protein
MNISKSRVLQILLAIVIAGFIGAAVYTSSLALQRQTALEDVGRHNVTWEVSQGLSEFARLEQRISEYGMGGRAVDAAEVKLRFDIVANRLKTLKNSSVARFIDAAPRNAATLGKLEQLLKTTRLLLDQLAVPGTASRLLDQISAVYPDLARLSSDSNIWNAHQINNDRKELIRLHWVYTSVTAGLILCGFAFIALLLLHNRLLKRTQIKLYATSSELQTTTNELEVSNSEVREKNSALLQQNLALRQQDAALQTQNARFDAALNNMSQGLCLADADQRLIVCNKRFLKLFNLDAELARQGAPLGDLLQPQMLPLAAAHSSETGWAPKSGTEQITAKAFGDRTHRMDDGTVLFVSHEPMAEGGWVSTFEDVTERRHAQDRIVHMAHHDALTDMPNRLLFWDNTEQAIRRLEFSGQSFAVLYLDLDRFKEVNDTLGHPVGDALLCAVAERLQANTSMPDLVARLGGDEFAILHRFDHQTESSTDELAERLLREISQPFLVHGHEVVVSTSIGIAIAPKDGSTTDELMKNADLALYRAKETGANTYQRFNPEMQAKLQLRRSLEIDLRRGLELGQFQLLYQPLVSLRTDQIVCGEALLRWNHPEHGLISPAEFIPIAEETGFINNLGEWALQRACADAAKWPGRVRVAVNLSPVQFRGSSLYQTVESALATSGLPAHRLELEITESVLLQNNTMNLNVLHRLRALGLSIALDDFGTGYSSLSYLRSFPFDKIKIDQTFVRDLENCDDSIAIIHSIADLGRSLKMVTTAEGVETPEQLNIVREAGCTEAQGYYFSRPVDSHSFEALVGSKLGSAA